MSVEELDILIVGAGLSGIGAACHLRRECPDKRLAIIEGRAALGQRLRIAAALEITHHTHALGMVAPVARVYATVLFQCVDKAFGLQAPGVRRHFPPLTGHGLGKTSAGLVLGWAPSARVARIAVRTPVTTATVRETRA